MKLVRKLNDKVNTLFHSRWMNKYTISAFLFIAWLSFFDKHNIVTQWQLRQTVKEMKDAKSDYNKLLISALDEKDDLEKNTERFAREKYFMHRPDEEVFIIDRK